MKTHLRSIAKRKVSDFLLREDGMVGSRTAFATAALVSTTALAMTVLVAPDADAHGVHCPDANKHCALGERCCHEFVNQRHYYDCVDIRKKCPDRDGNGF
ncbi:MAG: hypothetical protein OXN17_05885 [Candidatus Poribacteria bacterium]|nr:hypothetical protein [Candidatus Poribacteria bacterium]MDE0505436.1 hypothetical protein [Candidatus Poribacteria bacterium]